MKSPRLLFLRAFLAGATLLAYAFGSPGDLRAAEAKPSPEEQIAKVKADLQSGDATVRQAAIGSLVHSTISPKLFAEMRSALSDSDEVVRSRAATAIGNLGADAVVAVPQLAAGLKADPAKEARETAAHALGGLGIVAKDAGPEIVNVLKHETDAHRRGYVARALGNTGDPASLPVLEEALKAETDPGAQGKCGGPSAS